jgi:hypothetical protein
VTEAPPEIPQPPDPMVAPASTVCVPPAKAKVPKPVTGPKKVEPVPVRLRVSPELIERVVPASSVNTPPMVELPFTVIAAALERRTLEAPRLAPASTASVPPERTSTPPPLTVPAKVVAPVRVRVSPVAMVRVPAASSKVPP